MYEIYFKPIAVNKRIDRIFQPDNNRQEGRAGCEAAPPFFASINPVRLKGTGHTVHRGTG
jgi:hypothetical protein